LLHVGIGRGETPGDGVRSKLDVKFTSCGLGLDRRSR
jgi:hypothetical protein